MKPHKIHILRGAITDTIFADKATVKETRNQLVLWRGDKEVGWYRLSEIDGWVTDEGLQETSAEDA